MSKSNVVRVQVFEEVSKERDRQEELKASGKFLWTPADRSYEKVFHCPGMDPVFQRVIIQPEAKLAVLAEEFGEVSREVTELMIGDDKFDTGSAQAARVAKLRAELVQTAAVCVGWLESMTPVIP